MLGIELQQLQADLWLTLWDSPLQLAPALSPCPSGHPFPTAITAALSVSALHSTTSITGPVQRWRCQIKRYICICYIQAYFLLRSHFIYLKTLTTQSHLNSDLCLLRKHQFPLQNLEEKNKTSLSKERVFLCHFRAFSPTPVLGSLLPFPCNKIDYPLAFLPPCDLALHITGHFS